MYKIIGADGKEYGPVAADVLRRWVVDGRANSQTRVLLEGTTEWRALGDFPELTATLAVPQTIGALPGAGAGATAPTTNPMALTGFILSLVSITIGLCCCYGLPFNILGIIFSAIGLSQIKRNPEKHTGRGLALAGLIISIVSLLLAVGLFVVGVALSWTDIMRELDKL